MKLRNQLILAFLLLSVVPLVTIVLYGYYSAEAALAGAARSESAQLADDLRGRLSEVRQRLQHLSRLDGARLLANDGEFLQRSVQGVPGVEGWQFAPFPGVVVPAEEGDVASTSTVPGGVPEGEQRTFVYVLGAPEAPAAPVAPEPPLVHGSESPRATPRLQAPESREAPSVLRDLQEAEDIDAELKMQFGETVLAARDIALTHLLEQMGQALEQHADAEGTADYLQPLVHIARSWELNTLLRGQLQRENELTRQVLGSDFEVEVKDAGRVVGILRPRIEAKKMIYSLLSGTRRQRGDVAFAVDSEGELYALPDDRERLAELDLLDSEGHLRPNLQQAAPDYVLSTLVDEPSGLTVGILRPTGEAVAGLRRNAAINLAFGLGIVALALLGILPLSGRLTRSLGELANGAERLAHGDLQVRVPVRSNNEVGHLARAFNHMAFELSEHQQRLLDGERRHKEQEIHQRLLEAENHRKSQELEEARRFQLALLPRTLPRLPYLSIAVHTKTAAEVGGDYYDFLLQGGASTDGVLTAVIGDATGHGARAGTMVAVIKSLFTAHAAVTEPPEFLSRASTTIKGMGLGRMAMALTLLRFDGYRLTAACAGMPPLLLYRRAQGSVEEVALPGMPLGGVLDFKYRAWQAQLEPGDTVLLMSDGFPERVNAAGDVMGYERAREVFAAVAEQEPDAIVAALDRAGGEWAAGHPLEDDMTFVVFQLT